MHTHTRPGKRMRDLQVDEDRDGEAGTGGCEGEEGREASTCAGAPWPGHVKASRPNTLFPWGHFLLHHFPTFINWIPL